MPRYSSENRAATVKAAAGILLVFILGAATGAVVSHRFDCRQHDTAGHHNATDSQGREDEIVARLTRKLDLDPSQQAAVRSIVHQDRLVIRDIRGQAQGRVQAIIEEGQKHIAALLRPEQQEKFRLLVEEHRRRRAQQQAN